MPPSVSMVTPTADLEVESEGFRVSEMTEPLEITQSLTPSSEIWTYHDPELPKTREWMLEKRTRSQVCGPVHRPSQVTVTPCSACDVKMLGRVGKHDES